ncbi:urease accessory protein UreD [Planosporangium sp. 12N6]|uniref:urease accessory protein UreD n=1 Tax=Planosporangium spinosum TaxID=3402278 RepID=UPI003CFB00E9
MRSLNAVPELAPYHDEPAQLPSGASGKDGSLHLGFARRGARTALVGLRYRPPLLVQRELHWDEELPDAACVVVVDTAGGVVQGDRYTVDVDLGERARAHVTTQSATRIQEMDANYASQVQRLVLRDGAYLEYLPEPVIPHRHSRFVTRTHVRLPETATLVYAEILLPGRTHYRTGEVFGYDLYSCGLSASRPDGTPLFAEKYLIEPGRCSPARLGVLDGYRVFGNVLLLTSAAAAERVLARVPAVVDRAGRRAAGASRLPNGAGLSYRILAMESEPVRAMVRDFWSTARRAVTGRPAPPPFPWR